MPRITPSPPPGGRGLGGGGGWGAGEPARSNGGATHLPLPPLARRAPPSPPASGRRGARARRGSRSIATGALDESRCPTRRDPAIDDRRGRDDTEQAATGG